VVARSRGDGDALAHLGIESAAGANLYHPGACRGRNAALRAGHESRTIHQPSIKGRRIEGTERCAGRFKALVLESLLGHRRGADYANEKHDKKEDRTLAWGNSKGIGAAELLLHCEGFDSAFQISEESGEKHPGISGLACHVLNTMFELGRPASKALRT